MLYLCWPVLADLPTLFPESFLSLPALHPSAGGGALGASHSRRIRRKRPAAAKPAGGEWSDPGRPREFARNGVRPGELKPWGFQLATNKVISVAAARAIFAQGNYREPILLSAG
jgi:hypothetical protein